MKELEHLIDPECWIRPRLFGAFLGASPSCFRNLTTFDQARCHLKQRTSLTANAPGAQPVSKALILRSAKGESDKHIHQASVHQDLHKQKMKLFSNSSNGISSPIKVLLSHLIAGQFIAKIP